MSVEIGIFIVYTDKKPIAYLSYTKYYTIPGSYQGNIWPDLIMYF